MKNFLKNINIEIAAFGLLIASIGLQIMHLDNVTVDNIAGGIIALCGVYVLANCKKQISK